MITFAKNILILGLLLLSVGSFAEDGKGDFSVNPSDLTVETTQIQPAEIVSGPTASEIVFETKNGVRFVLSKVPLSQAGIDAFNSLDEFHKAKFMKVRQDFFKLAVPAVSRSELSLGFGSVIKNTLRHFFFWKKKKERVYEELARQVLPDNQETPKNLREKGRVFAQQVLQGIDKMLWEKARDVVAKNEFAMQVSVGVVLAGGTPKVKVKSVNIPGISIGGMQSYGFKLGYNSRFNNLLYETYSERETLKEAYFIPFLAGIIPKIGWVMSANTEEGRGYDGETFYPPGIPGYRTSGEDYSVVGTSVSLLAFPQGIGEFYTYKTKVSVKTLTRKFFRSSGQPVTAPIQELAQATVELAPLVTPLQDTPAEVQCVEKLRDAS
jgi:hypothetical protein